MIGYEMELSGKSFAEAAAEVRAVCGRTERRPKGPIVASYDYVDEDGKLLFQCLRYEPKAFSQRRPNGRGGWISKPPGSTPRVIQAARNQKRGNGSGRRR